MGESTPDEGDSVVGSVHESEASTSKASPMQTTKLAGRPPIAPDCNTNLQLNPSVTERLQNIPETPKLKSITQPSRENLVAPPAISANEEKLLQGLVCLGGWVNLSIDTINMKIDGSTAKIQAKDCFLNDRQRTIIQVAAVAEEVKLEKTKAALCRKLGSAFGVIPLQDKRTMVGKKLGNEEDSKMLTAQQYLVAMDTSDKRLVRALPGIGQKVKLRFKLGYDRSRFPVVKIKESQIEAAAQYILDELDPAKNPVSDSEDSDSDGMDSDDTDSDDAHLENEYLTSRLESNNALPKTMQKLARAVSQFSETEDGSPSRSKAAQAALAIGSGVNLREHIPKQRVISWVSAHPWFRYSPEGTKWTDVKWSGTRVKPPPGVRSSKAFFQVATPSQPRWPCFLQNSTIKVLIPLPIQHDTLHQTIESMALRIRGRLTYKPDLKVQWFEGHVHEKLNMLQCDGPLSGWWEYILDFQTLDPDFHRNLHEVYPALPKHIKAGKFQGEHAAVAQALAKTTAGKFILSGCPGSGKSTFCQRLASAVVDEGWKPSAGYANGGQEKSMRAQIIYTSPQNEQCKDAIKRFKLLNPEKKACRLYGYNRELQALIRGDDEAEPDQGEGGKGKATNKLDKALKQHTQRSAIEHEDPRNPRLDPDSLSSIVRTNTTGNTLEELQKSWDLWRKDKQMWHRKEADFKQMGHRLLMDAVRNVDAFFGTLVAIAQCYDHMGKSQGVLGKPALLVVDEVARLNETHALIGVSLWKEVPTIFAGDEEQFGPFAATAGTQFSYSVRGKSFEFSSVVSAQLEKSLLSRAAAMGGIDARLTSNHRVYGSAGEFPCKLLYDGKMIQTHTEDSPATEAVSEWFARHSPGGKNSLLVDLDSEEEEQGTSKINRTSAYFVVQLAVDIAREMKLPLMQDYEQFKNPLENTSSIRKGRILILVAYAPQKVQVLLCLRKISAHEVDKSRITVRTIDDSPSHESEIVIVDLVRTEAIGFLAEPARLKVAATRAQLGTIWVTNKKICQRQDNTLRKLTKLPLHYVAYSSEWEKETWMSSPKSVDSVVRDPFVTK